MPDKKPDTDEYEKWVTEFAPLIRFLAHRMAFRLPPYMDVDDLIHAGVIGLMDAVGKFDPMKQVQFKTYAEFRIRGAMLDEIRALDWVPRSVHEKVHLFQKAYDQLAKELRRAPDESELAKALSMTMEEYEKFLSQAKGVSMLRLEDLVGPEETPFDTIADLQAEDPFTTLLAEDTRVELTDAISHLPEKEQRVVSLYYVEELTMKEIGKVLNITESRVCQLHTQAILRLKGLLGVRLGNAS
ncbi:MAG: FliA/WhiG family RNA polymerase sigma factor [Nitrospirota bacterium]